ncbi:hypothetical protein GNI_162850 [Gregarina niphandrodes]|uniref:Uncharacterized protein n=1 Tax=Gregarina niphandrodes TaxID=110365 RepID=A0A023AYC8_GRENI|nr:hypothetical protein GNI_162850 [Gregarina niphandrodes]EZG43672.1 hypothetical protein GNI_162850 [Gregarina niphandrodes]|eukprot:XP_011133098.1 hypothetical protein GNI_162850 [Gregarina niphandrodes]
MKTCALIASAVAVAQPALELEYGAFAPAAFAPAFAPSFDDRRAYGTTDRTFRDQYMNERLLKDDRSTVNSPRAWPTSQTLGLPAVGQPTITLADAPTLFPAYSSPLTTSQFGATQLGTQLGPQLGTQLGTTQLGNPLAYGPAFGIGGPAVGVGAPGMGYAPVDLGARRGNKLDITNTDNYNDKVAAQIGALEKMNHARASGPQYNTRDNLTPTSITTERNFVGPRARSDDIFRTGGAANYRDTGNYANRANRASARSFDPIYY